jgi:hypothetical protein
LFGTIIWKLLIIEPFFDEYYRKSNLKTILELGGILGVISKPLVSQI